MDVAKPSKKVLYITYDGLTDPLGQSQVLPYLIGLSKYGYEFTILSFEKKERLAKEGGIISQITQKANIKWMPLLFTARPPVISKMYDRYRLLQKAAELYKNNHFDLIHCRSYIAAEAGLQLKKRFGVKMLFDMRGFWADEKVDNGQWNMEKPLFKFIYRQYKKKEKAFLLQADGIVSLTQAAKDYLLQKKEYRHLSIEVIPCCADLEHFNYEHISVADVNKLKISLHIPENAKVMTYLGSVGGWYMTREMFAFFKILQQQCPEYVMLILTKDDPAQVKKEAVEMGIATDRLFVTYSNRKQLPLFLSLSNSSIFFIRNTFSKIASSPTKHAELMGMGIPVICNDIGDTGNIIKATKTGMLINEPDERDFQQAVNEWNRIEGLDKAAIRACAMTYFDLDKGIDKYLSLYNNILYPAGTPHASSMHV